MKKPKLGVPQLWYHNRSDSLRIAYPDGQVEMDTLWEDFGWAYSLYTEATQELAVKYLKMDDFEFVDNLEDT